MPTIGRRPGDAGSLSHAPATQSPEISRLDVFDCQSAFEVVDVLRQYKSIAGADPTLPAPNFDYRACFEVLQESRQRMGFAPSQNTLALATVDPESEGQARFLTAISRLGVLVEPVDFRDASVTLPLVGDGDRSERRYLRSLAPNITYVLGLLAARPSPEVVIVTRAFELFGSLRDFVEKRGGKAAIAYFRRYLDPRFGLAGLFEVDSRVKFIDLEPFSERILGSDIRQIATATRPKNQGIAGV